MDQVSTVGRPRRPEYSAEFKASVLEQYRQPGVSVAGVALGRGINPNMVHRGMREERQRQMLATLQQGASAFVPLQMQPIPVIWLAARRLHQGKFIWLAAGGANLKLERAQLDALVLGFL